MTREERKVIRKEIVVEPTSRRKLARAFGIVILIMVLGGGSVLLAITIAAGDDVGSSVSVLVIIGGMIFWVIISAILIHLGRTMREVTEEVVKIDYRDEEEEGYEEKEKGNN
jgi:hypothetical protein